MMEFNFLDTNGLQNEEIELRLKRTVPHDPKKDYVPAYEFLIHNVCTGEEVGGINFRVGMTDMLYYAGNIGYSIHETHRGHRYAAQACKLVFSLAKKHSMHEVIITCNPDNKASSRTCELVDGKLVEIVDVPKQHEMYTRGYRKVCIYKIDLDTDGQPI